MVFRIWQFLLGYIVGTTVIVTTIHAQIFHHNFNLLHTSLACFVCLNALVCLWEIGLGLHIDHIKREYERCKKKYLPDKCFDAIVDFFLIELNLKKIFSLKHWGAVWFIYSLYDPSYSNRESYGFFVDVGNGWYTILPSLFFLASLTMDLASPLVVGVIGLLSFHTAWYGTVIYFLSYIMNKRYKGRSWLEIILFVVLTNGLWFILPLIGMYTSWQIMSTGSFALVR